MTKKIIKNPNLNPTNYQGLLTISPIMHTFMEKVSRIAQTNASVLVRGKTGTGKELVARYIHSHSCRSAQTFSAVNCAALTAELMASELFGHKRGAFTGAVNDRKGLLQLTDGGTLFLDEIAEMPLDIQARLLRVLQDQCFTPVGSSELIYTDIRLVSATNESLRKLVADKRFREDLMYRVRVIPIFLPTLAERREDIEMLVWHFVEEFNRKNDRKVTGISSNAFNALMEYAWPGNIRELRNSIEYSHSIGIGDTLFYEDLTPDIRGETPVDERDLDLNQMEREKILMLLQKHRGKKSVVAEEMQVSRATLWRKMKQYQIE